MSYIACLVVLCPQAGPPAPKVGRRPHGSVVASTRGVSGTICRTRMPNPTTSVRIPGDIKAALLKEARAQDRSLSWIIIDILKDWIKQRKSDTS